MVSLTISIIILAKKKKNPKDPERLKQRQIGYVSVLLIRDFSSNEKGGRKA